MPVPDQQTVSLEICHGKLCLTCPLRRAACRAAHDGYRQGEPAMIPVRSEDRSNSLNRGCSSSVMNIVGTP